MSEEKPYWVFDPPTGIFKNEVLTEQVRRAALEDTSPLGPDYDDPIPETEDAGWQFRYSGKMSGLQAQHFFPLYPFVRYAEGCGRRGELRAMIPTMLGGRKIVAWYVPKVR